MNTLTERIDFIIKNEHINRAYLAKSMGITQPALTKAIARGNLSIKLCEAIQDKYGYSYKWLMAGEGDPKLDNTIIQNRGLIVDPIKLEQDNAIANAKNPKIVQIPFKIDKNDNNSNATFVIDQLTEFEGEGLYVIDVANTPQVFYIKASVTGSILIESQNEKHDMSLIDFKKNIKLLGIVLGVFKMYG
jgi:hypothetical protein